MFTPLKAARLPDQRRAATAASDGIPELIEKSRLVLTPMFPQNTVGIRNSTR
jgi:hypothetical protein